MAESENDDLADALAQLASGDVAPSEHEPAGPIEHAPAKLVQPASLRQAVPRPAVAPPPAARPARPAAPVAGGQVPPSPASALETAPPAVTVRPVTPVLRRARPAAPTITQTPGEVEISGDESTALSGAMEDSPVVDEDDSVIMPAPDVSVFAKAVKKKSQSSAKAQAAAHKNLEFRRTMIPILLTCGVLMFGFASLKFVSGGESSLALLPIWVPVLLVIAGAIVLALGVLNIVTVKNQLAGKA